MSSSVFSYQPVMVPAIFGSPWTHCLNVSPKAVTSTRSRFISSVHEFKRRDRDQASRPPVGSIITCPFDP